MRMISEMSLLEAGLRLEELLSLTPKDRCYFSEAQSRDFKEQVSELRKRINFLHTKQGTNIKTGRS